MEKLHFFDAIEANKRNSILLILGMFLFSIFFLWIIVYVFSENILVAIILSFFISLLYISFAYTQGMNVILGISNAVPLDRNAHPYLYNVVEGLSIAAGIPVPKTYIIEDPSPNAFATGRDPNHASIVVTRGLLEKLERRELSGVIAHEVSHIANYDIRYMMMTIVLVGFVAIISNIFARSMFHSSGSSRKGGPLIIIAIVLMIVAPIFAELVRFAISREREYLSDANGAKLTRDPGGLASALLKIGGSKSSVTSASNVTAPLYFSDPMIGKFQGLFSTHPPIEERVKRLRSM